MYNDTMAHLTDGLRQWIKFAHERCRHQSELILPPGMSSTIFCLSETFLQVPRSMVRPCTACVCVTMTFSRQLCLQEVASVLFSLANLAAHAHCLLRFVALLRRLAKGSGSSPRTDASEAIYMNGRGQLGGDSGYSLGRPGSPQRAAGAKQTANLRGSGGSSGGGAGGGAESRGSGGDGSSTTFASRLGISPVSNDPDSAILSGSGSAGSRRGVRKHVQMLNAAYPFWPLWLLYACIAVAAWAASVAFHARDMKATERTDYLLADALILYGFLVTVARTLG